MKINKKSLALSSLFLASMFLVSCGEEEISNVYKVNYKQDLKAVQVNTTIDLDDYLSLVRQNKKEDETYTVTCSDESVKIDGHKITPTKIGNFDLHLKDDRVQFDNKLTLDSRSEDNMTLIKFFDKLAETPTNYEIDFMDFNSAGTALTYGGLSYVHTPNYTAAFNLSDPGQTYKNGDPNSFILAMLTNEAGETNGFEGYFNTKGDPVFYPGALANYAYYYVNMDMPVDGYSFTSEMSEGDDGEEVETLVGDALFTDNLLLYGCSSRIPEFYTTSDGTTYKLETGGTILLGMDDTDNDDEIDTLYLYTYCNATNVATNETGIMGYTPLRLCDVGNAKVAKLEKAISDPSYYPKKLESPEITTAFKDVTDAKNYTVTIDLAPSSSKSNSSTALYEYFFGKGVTAPIQEVNKITEDGISMKLTQGEDVTEAAFFNKDGKAYKTETKESGIVAKEIVGKTSVWDEEGINAFTAKAVTSDAIDETVWKAKKVDTTGKLITYRGDIGDDDGAGNKTNTLFQQLFDQLALRSWKDNGFGTLLSDAGMIFQSAAGTTSSNYSSFAVNTETKEIVVKALLYLPVEQFSGSYIDCTYRVSNVGTTTNDFSKYTVA